MTDMHPGNGGAQQPGDDARALAVKAQHRHEMAVMDQQLTANMPLSLQVFFNERLHQRLQHAATMMAAAQGFIPQHLAGKTEACFAILTKALVWKLDPYAIAASTFQVGGKVGYEGKLVQAIIEQSGRFRWADPDYDDKGNPIPGTGPIEYVPNVTAWNAVQGKFRMDGNRPVALWDREKDEEGLGIRYRYHVDNGPRREWTFFLKQAVIRNSTLWPTDPMTQCHYAGVRRLASVACPSLIMGIPSPDDQPDMPAMKDITPPAPPPVDLDAEQIKPGPAPQPQDAPERAAQGTADGDGKPSLFEATVGGTLYTRPGNAANALIKLVKAASDPDAVLDQHEVVLIAMPDEHRRRVESACKARWEELDASRGPELVLGPSELPMPEPDDYGADDGGDAGRF